MRFESLNVAFDINQDGAHSAWEIWEGIKFVYRLPGNLAVEVLGQSPFLADWLNIRASDETGYASLDGTLAIALSLIFWTAVLFAILALSSPDAPEAKQPDTRRLPDRSHGLPERPIVAAARSHIYAAPSHPGYGHPRRMRRHHRRHLADAFGPWR